MRKPTLGILLLVSAFPLKTAALGVQHDTNVPGQIFSAFDSTAPPTWVSASATTDEQGTFNWDVLRPSIGRFYKEFLKDPLYENLGCIGVTSFNTTPPPSAKSHKTLEDLILNSAAIYEGEVVASEPGFYDSHPGTLVKFAVTDKLKHSEEFWLDPYLFIFYPVGNFRAGDLRFCASDSKFPRPPKIGDKILVFPYSLPVDGNRQIIFPSFQEFLTQGKHGDLIIPPPLSRDPTLLTLRSINQIKAHVEQKLNVSINHPQ